MAKLFSQIWILICAVFLVQLPVTRSQFCSPGWKFHSLTGSCMGLLKIYYTYVDARNYCENVRTGSTKGHLVFIFDKATDDLVKDLLDENKVDYAFIGLHDRGTNGFYAWGDNSPIPTTYRGWSDSSFTPDSRMTSVIITKDGWQEYRGDYYAYFVCQVQADFPKPNITCPVAEEGHNSPDISCTVDFHSSFAITSLIFKDTEAQVASCNASKCLSNPRYDASKSLATSKSQSWNLKVRNVTRSCDTDWTCSVQFNNIALWVTSNTCSLKVYTKPTGIQCSHSFVESLIKVTCTAEKFYPKMDCSWTGKYESWEHRAHNTSLENVWYESGQSYYKLTCNALFAVAGAGRYNITVSMFSTGVGVYTPRDITVSVEPPEEAPKFYLFVELLQSSWLEITENSTMNLTCQVPGGDPPVYKTMIKCDQMPQKYESEGSSVNIDIRITQEWHGRKCTCSAVHAASYKQKSTVEIRVKYPTQVTYFLISPLYNIRKGDSVTFTCRASGNPIPQLTLHRQDGSTFFNSSTGYLKHEKKAACSDTGKYVCLTNNTVNGLHYQNSKDEYLKVRCAPEHRNEMSSQRFPVDIASTTGAGIKICVRAFPAPTSYTLYKGNTTQHAVSVLSSKYNVYFNFTSEEDGLGEITVSISPFTQADTGDYTLYSINRQSGTVDVSSYLRFHLFPQGPPSCPTNFTVVGADSDSVRLSWTPGFNGGLKQTFTVLRVDTPSVTSSSPSGFMKLGTVEEQVEDIVYTVTGLSESTMYTLGLEATNEKGNGNCSHVQVNVSTSASPATLVDGNGVTAIVVIVILLLIILVVVAVMVIRRRRGYLFTKPVKTVDAAQSGAGETSRVAYSDIKGDNMYANSTSKGIKKANKHEKPPRKTNEDTDQNLLYAQINPQTKKGKKKENNAKGNNDTADVYQNVSKLNVVPTSAAADDDSVYANAHLTTKGDSTPDKNKDSSRTVNEDGLVYTTVEINKKTTNPEIVAVKKPAGKQAQPEHESVEYIAINFSATAKQE